MKIISIQGKDIYPFSMENFEAVIKFHLENNGITHWGKRTKEEQYNEARKLKLYEFEHLMMLANQHISEFSKDLVHSPMTIDNLSTYALDAYYGKSSGSFARINIQRKFADALLASVETI